MHACVYARVWCVCACVRTVVRTPIGGAVALPSVSEPSGIHVDLGGGRLSDGRLVADVREGGLKALAAVVCPPG